MEIIGLCIGLAIGFCTGVSLPTAIKKIYNYWCDYSESPIVSASSLVY